MQTITDNELDLLLKESADRKQLLAQVNTEVMRTVRRDMRRKQLLRWGRLLAFCFGLPLLAVLYVFVLRTYVPAMPPALTIAYYVLPLSTLLYYVTKKSHRLSSDLFEVLSL